MFEFGIDSGIILKNHLITKWTKPKKDGERVRHGICKVAANRIRPQVNPLSQSLTPSSSSHKNLGRETEWA
jgi:hypothetical protein